MKTKSVSFTWIFALLAACSSSNSPPTPPTDSGGSVLDSSTTPTSDASAPTGDASAPDAISSLVDATSDSASVLDGTSQDVSTSSPITLASGHGYTAGIAVDDTNVYWTVDGAVIEDGGLEDNGFVMKVPVGGGTPTTLVGPTLATCVPCITAYNTPCQLGPVDIASGTTCYSSGSDDAGAIPHLNPMAIAVGPTSVYWTTEGSGVYLGAVMQTPIAGGASSILVNYSNLTAGQLALDSNYVYWSDSTQQGVLKVPIDGGSPTIIESGKDGGANNPIGIAVDSTSVYWSNYASATGAVMKAPLAGGAPMQLATGGQPIVVDSTNVYFSDVATVMKVPLGGGTSTTLATPPAPYGWGAIGAMAVDGISVYFTTENGVMKVPVGGGAVTTMASVLSPTGIAVDATSVYWIAPSTGNDYIVSKLTPK